MEQKASSTAVAAVTHSPIETVKQWFEGNKPQLVAALPRTLGADKFLRVAYTCIQRNPMLGECAPVTLIGGMIQAAQLGLVLDGVLGEAYLVPFRNNKKNRLEAQFMVGYKGIRKLVNNTGEIETFLPQVVYFGDEFDYNLSEARIRSHKRTSNTLYGKPTHFYTVVQWKSGHTESWIMPKEEIDHVRDSFSKAYQQAVRNKAPEDSIWFVHYEAMGLKTVMRRHGKYLPLSADANRALQLDERAGAGLAQDLGMLIDPTEKETPDNAPVETPAIREPQRKGREAGEDEDAINKRP